MKRNSESFSVKQERRVGFYFGVCVGAVGVWILYGVFESFSMLSSPLFWSSIAAIGTVAAVVTALYLNYKNDNSEKNKKVLNAKLYALDKKIGLQYLVNLSNEIQRLNFSLLEVNERDTKLKKIETYLIDYFNAYRDLDLSLDKLFPIGGNVASNLAVGMSQFRQGAMAVRFFITQSHDFTETKFQELVVRNHVWLMGGAGITKIGFDRLSQVADEFFLHGK